MFKSQNPRSRWKKIRNTLWPEMGIRRLLRYYRHRMGRMQGTPWYIAAGLATGIAVSFTPFVGFHLVLGLLLCWLLRASIISMVMGTLIGGNIWTLPLCLLASYRLGIVLLGHAEGHSGSIASAPSFSLIMKHPFEIFLPMTVGAVPLTLVSWLLSFYIVRGMIKKYRESGQRSRRRPRVR